MSTAAEFFRDIRNTRMCLLYEYLRGLSPHQAQIEMLFATGEFVPLDAINELFPRFRTNDFDVNLATNTTDNINDDKPGTKNTKDEEKQKKYDDVQIEKEYEFEPDEESINLLNFFSDLETLKNDERFKVTELEINVKNDAQPKHVLIAVQYATSAKPQDFLSVEIYHCSNGVVIRRGKQTKLLESAEHYKYYEVARNAVKKLWETLKVREMVEVDFLKLSIDSNVNKPPSPKVYSEDHVDLFNKLMALLGIRPLSDTLGPADLIKFHEKVKVSRELDIQYGKCEIANKSARYVEAGSGGTDKSSGLACSRPGADPNKPVMKFRIRERGRQANDDSDEDAPSSPEPEVPAKSSDNAHIVYILHYNYVGSPFLMELKTRYIVKPDQKVQELLDLALNSFGILEYRKDWKLCHGHDGTFLPADETVQEETDNCELLLLNRVKWDGRTNGAVVDPLYLIINEPHVPEDLNN